MKVSIAVMKGADQIGDQTICHSVTDTRESKKPGGKRNYKAPSLEKATKATTVLEKGET